MKKTMMRLLTIVGVLVFATMLVAAPMSTAFTYQGQLKSQGVPLNGTADLAFVLVASEFNGAILATVAHQNIEITNGLFSVTLDFGAAMFIDEPRWLEIYIRSPHDPTDTVQHTMLTPRQLITATPYALYALNGSSDQHSLNAADGDPVDALFVDDSGDVGIGTTTPQRALHVVGDGIFGENATQALGYGVRGESGGTLGRGVYGEATASSSVTYGVLGESASTDGRGVYGWAKSSTGNTYGVQGESASTDGRGVYGLAAASTGPTEGVRGVSYSTDGRGVYGLATASTGPTEGVRGESRSGDGHGVYGLNIALSGTTYGVRGQSDSPDGTGVFGLHSSAAGFAAGVHGETDSTSPNAVAVYGRVNSPSAGASSAAVRGDNRGIGGQGIGVWGSQIGSGWGVYGTTNGGTGVYGSALSLSGDSIGVRGQTASISGIGVLGEATAGSGETIGVSGTSDSDEGKGVKGVTSFGFGNTNGVYGESMSKAGTGVVGFVAHSSGFTRGVLGRSNSTSGKGVVGWAWASTGENYGVWGESASDKGYDFYAAGAGMDYGSESSGRWKNNVRNIDRPLDKVARLRGVYFDWNKDHGGHHDVGMIAEEVGAVLPEIVKYEENGVDASGMDYSKLTPLLVEAVNALRVEKDSQIETQQDQIAALRSELSEIKESIRKTTPSTRASALGMASPVLATACLIGMVMMGRGRNQMRGER